MKTEVTALATIPTALVATDNNQELQVVDNPSELALALVDEPTDLVISEPQVRKQMLSFTLVDGYLRGEHRCRFELHATGCRDLKKAQRTMASVEIIGRREQRHEDCLDGVLGEAIEQLAGTGSRKDIWVQPCCNIKRMEAIGRA